MEVEYITAYEATRKLFGSEILFLSWVLFLMHLVLWISIVTIVEPLHKQRSLRHTKEPNTCTMALPSHSRNHWSR
jgi:hypothetical protein